MFKKELLIALCVLAAISFLVAWNLAWVDEEAHLAYRQLVELGAAPKNDTSYTAKQKREGVYKHVVFKNGLELALKSKRSQFVYERNEGSAQLVEKMEHVTCFMQEEVGYDEQKKPIQVVRYMEADQADYFYKTEEFKASNVKMLRYTVAGHDLPTHFAGLKPTMRGTAESVQFFLSGSDLNFKADKLKLAMEKKG